MRATLMQTEALQHRLCSSVMRQYNGESLELLESGLNVPGVSIALLWLLLPSEVGVNCSFVAPIATGSRCQ